MRTSLRKYKSGLAIRNPRTGKFYRGYISSISEPLSSFKYRTGMRAYNPRTGRFYGGKTNNVSAKKKCTPTRTIKRHLDYDKKKFITIKISTSSNLQAAHYEIQKKRLIIDFSSASYVYSPVPLTVWKRFVKSHSKGSFLHDFIIDIFQCRKID